MKSARLPVPLRIFRRSRADPVDRPTLAAYDSDAAGFARDWHEQPAPVDLHGVVKRFFIQGGSTADIRCGRGPGGAGVEANGGSAGGFGAPEGPLSQTRSRRPPFRVVYAVVS